MGTPEGAAGSWHNLHPFWPFGESSGWKISSLSLFSAFQVNYYVFFKGKAKMYGLEGVKALRLYLAAPKETRVLKSSSSTV